MRFAMFVCGLTAVVLATPASADHSKSEDKSADKMVCKREIRTGTRFAMKICKKASDWDQIAEQHRRDLDEFTDLARNNSAKGD